jgi:hypothetical protein
MAVAAGGVAVSSFGYAGLYFGREIALGGYALGVVVVVAGFWSFARRKDEAGRSTPQGIAQYLNSLGEMGRQRLAEMAPFLDMAQTADARAMVRAETK